MTSSFDIAVLAANLAEEKKTEETVILKVDEISIISDYFVITSVDNRAQMRATANAIIDAFKKRQLHPVGVEWDKTGGWTLLDFGEVVIHLFNTQQREFYALERFWNHATEVPRQDWHDHAARQAS